MCRIFVMNVHFGSIWRFLFVLFTVGEIWLGIAAPDEKRDKARRYRRILDIDDAVKRKEHERNHYIGYLTDQVTYETWPEMKVQNVEDGCRIWVKAFVPRSPLSNLTARMGNARLEYEMIDVIIENGQPQLINVAVLMCSLPERSRGHTALNFIRSPKLNCVYLIKRPHSWKRYFRIYKELCRTLTPDNLVNLKSFNIQKELEVGAVSDNCLTDLPVQPPLLQTDGMSTNKEVNISENSHTNLPYLHPSGEQSTTIPGDNLQIDPDSLQIEGQFYNLIEDFFTDLPFHSLLSNNDGQSMNKEGNISEGFHIGLPYLQPSGEQSTTIPGDNIQTDTHLLQIDGQSINEVVHVSEVFPIDSQFHSQLSHIERQSTNEDRNISETIHTGLSYLQQSCEQSTIIPGNNLQIDPHLLQYDGQIGHLSENFFTDLPFHSQLFDIDGQSMNKEGNISEGFHKGLPYLQPSGEQSTTIPGDNIQTDPHLLQIEGQSVNEVVEIPEVFLTDSQFHSQISHTDRQSTNEEGNISESIHTGLPYLQPSCEQSTTTPGDKSQIEPHLLQYDGQTGHLNEDLFTDFLHRSQLSYMDGQTIYKEGNIFESLPTGQPYLQPNCEQSTNISEDNLQIDPHSLQIDGQVGNLSEDFFTDFPFHFQPSRFDGQSTNKGGNISEVFHKGLPYLQPRGKQLTTIPGGNLQTGPDILQIYGQSRNEVVDVPENVLTNLPIHSQLSKNDGESANKEGNMSEDFHLGIPNLHPTGEQATTISGGNLEIDSHLQLFGGPFIHEVEDIPEEFFTNLPLHSYLLHPDGQPTNKVEKMTEDFSTGQSSFDQHLQQNYSQPTSDGEVGITEHPHF